MSRQYITYFPFLQEKVIVVQSSNKSSQLDLFNKLTSGTPTTWIQTGSNHVESQPTEHFQTELFITGCYIFSQINIYL